MTNQIDQVDQPPAWTTPAAPSAPAAPPKPPSRLKTLVVGAVAALVIGGGGFAVVRAASDSTTSTTSQQAGPGGNQQGGPGGFGGGAGDRAGGGAALAGAMYGDFTASDGNGGYLTRRLQSGTVTAVSATSITAKSDDGHATTFAVGPSTTVDNGDDQVSDIKTGDTVTVVGTVQGDTVTATTITDTTLR